MCNEKIINYCIIDTSSDHSKKGLSNMNDQVVQYIKDGRQPLGWISYYRGKYTQAMVKYDAEESVVKDSFTTEEDSDREATPSRIPEQYEEYYYVNWDFEIEEDVFSCNDARDVWMMRNGNYFKTKEDAEAVRDLKLFVLDNWNEIQGNISRWVWCFDNLKCQIGSQNLLMRCKQIIYHSNFWKFIWLPWLQDG